MGGGVLYQKQISSDGFKKSSKWGEKQKKEGIQNLLTGKIAKLHTQNCTQNTQKLP